jgi:hypothetical protein
MFATRQGDVLCGEKELKTQEDQVINFWNPPAIRHKPMHGMEEDKY